MNTIEKYVQETTYTTYKIHSIRICLLNLTVKQFYMNSIRYLR